MKMVDRDKLVQLAKLAELAQRYDDMAAAMRELTEGCGGDLTIEERNLLSAAYKSVIAVRRAAWRVIASIEAATVALRERVIAAEYKLMVEQEIKDTCHQVLSLLDSYLLPKSNSAEPKVFYLKMKGDYFRYLSEVTHTGELGELVTNSQTAYHEAYEMAKCKMQPSHPMRLGVALNFSVFYYEILNAPDRACHLAKRAFDDANAELDSLSEEQSRDSKMIMHLLRDNLLLWISTMPQDEQEDNPAARLYPHPSAAEATVAGGGI